MSKEAEKYVNKGKYKFCLHFWAGAEGWKSQQGRLRAGAYGRKTKNSLFRVWVPVIASGIATLFVWEWYLIGKFLDWADLWTSKWDLLNLRPRRYSERISLRVLFGEGPDPYLCETYPEGEGCDFGKGFGSWERDCRRNWRPEQEVEQLECHFDHEVWLRLKLVAFCPRIVRGLPVFCSAQSGHPWCVGNCSLQRPRLLR